MKRYSGFLMVALAAIFLSGCIGSGGSSAPAPNHVAVVEKDSRVIVTWDMVPGVEYWIFKAAGSGVTPQNCSAMLECSTAVNVTSPASISGLTNGQIYSFSVNGRIDGGPGGPGSVAVDATPRQAGAIWTAGTSPSASKDLLGVAYGAYDATGSKYVAVGTACAMYSGTVYTDVDPGTGLAKTGITWNLLDYPSGVPATTNLNAVNYDSYRGKYLSVGTGGVILAMTPATSTAWTPSSTGYTAGESLLAIANNSAITVVTGANGTIIRSVDGGANWSHATSILPTTPTASLNGVAYGNGVFVAVGASGTLLYSADGDAWTNVTSTAITTANLNGVTYGGLDANDKSVFVAVGASGTVLTSENGVDWTPQSATTIPSSSNLNAVTYSSGRRFVAVAANGNIYYSDYYSSGTTTGNGAVSWTPVTAPVASLNAIAVGGLYDFVAVGAAGINAYAD
jgi:hypothetical protein